MFTSLSHCQTLNHLIYTNYDTLSREEASAEWPGNIKLCIFCKVTLFIWLAQLHGWSLAVTTTDLYPDGDHISFCASLIPVSSGPANSWLSLSDGPVRPYKICCPVPFLVKWIARWVCQKNLVSSVAWWGFPGNSVVKNPPAKARDSRDLGSIPGSGRSPAGGNGNQLQCSRLGSPMDRGAWQRRTESDTTEQLSTHAVWLGRW